MLSCLTVTSGKLLFRAGIVFLIGSAKSGLTAENLAPERLWTSEEGKQIRAELVRFEGELGWYRTTDGVIHKLADERFFSEDRLLLARLRSENVLRKRASRVSGGSYYDSPLDDGMDGDKLWPYIKERSGNIDLECALYRLAPCLKEHRVVTFQPDEGPAFQISYDPDSLSSTAMGPNRDRLSLNLERNPERQEALWAAITSGGLSVIVGEGASAVKSKITAKELAALRDVFDVHERMKPFVADGSWFESDSGPVESSGGLSSPPTDGELAPFRDAGLKPLIVRKLWKGAGGDDLLTAPVYGFVRNFVILKSGKGEVISKSFEAFDQSERRSLVEARITQSFEEDIESVDDISLYEWKPWKERPVQRTLRLARDRGTGKPLLFLDSYSYSFHSLENPPQSVRVRHDSVSSTANLTIPSGQSVIFYENSRKIEKPWLRYTFPIPETEARDLLALVGAREIVFIVSDGSAREDLKLREDQIAGSQEVLHCFRWLLDLEGK